MIKIKKVNKYFNRRKKNQIHVINNTELEFAATGLVALLGPSGCGKTTLLNVIGGLDKVNGGAIYINDKKLTRWSDNSIDNMRNRDIGYVFQDYCLIDDLTVFDNVALALRMIGVTDKEELKSRVHYVLQAVGLYRYRNRYTDMLSGGERQRVAIARAIVKDPKIIIADEPTGNLDSRNTLEIMKITKAISSHRLVILVTHERDLANFYASRIIEISDGVVISDKVNDHEDELDYRIDQKIYLKDIANNKKTRVGNLDIDFYGDNSDKIDITIVVKSNNLYIKGPQGQRIENITNHSMVELVDDHYRKINKEDSSDEFDMSKAKNKDFRLRYHSIFNVFSLLSTGYKKVMSYSLLRKILLLAFLVSAMAATFSVSSIVGTLTYDDSYFLSVNKDYISYKANLTVDDFLELENDPLVKDLLIGTSLVNFQFPFNNYYQTFNNSASLNGSLTNIDLLESENLVYGRLPENEFEMVVDIMTLTKMNEYSNGSVQQAGLIDITDFLNRPVSNRLLGEFTIVGIADQKSPCIFMDKDIFINLIASQESDMFFKDGMYVQSYTVYAGDGQESVYDYRYATNISRKKGRWPENDYEVMVNYENRYEMKLNKTINYRVNNIKLKVVGYYISERGDYNYYVNENTLKYQNILKNNEFSIIAYDKASTLKEFQEIRSMNAVDSYVEAENKFLESRRDSRRSSLAFSGITIVICIVEIYLVIRASFLARIKEVGVYRAIGMKKFDIYKMFLGEILVITVATSFIGVAVMSYILLGMQNIPYANQVFVINWQVVAVTTIGLLLVNVIFGLLPVYQVIRKKPAAILARSDV